MSFYDDNAPDKPLMSFTLKRSDHVDRDAFIKSALAEFQRRAASGAEVKDRIVFLLKFDEVDLARTSIRQCATASANDWMDQLLAYVIDVKTDAASSKRLLAWAEKMGDFSADLMAAYAFEAAGDHDATENSIKTALAKPVDDPDWSGYNARYRGAAICAKLLQARRYATCAALCKALIAYTDSKTYLAPEITSILKSAQAAQANPDSHPSPPSFSEGTYFDPFKGIDLSRLIASHKEVAGPQPVSNNDRLLEYYDHRISADPQNRDNYTIKIAFLLSLNRRDDAFTVCKTAENVFPDWWRPPTILAFAADDNSRPQAETQFRRWVEAHPAFIHWWYLSRYDRTHGKIDAAIADLQNGVKYPLEMVDEDETWVPMAFAFDAASFAYAQKKYDGVLTIAEVWSKPQGIYNYFDDDIYAFRSAAELALGRFVEAKKDADAVVAAASKHAIWASDLAELQQAAAAHDQTFMYNPGTLGCGGDWSAIPTVQP
jgi:tetratricopeptide (TPR) repeat protein